MIQKFLINPENSIKEALNLIHKNSHRCLAVVDKKRKLLGTLSDGDIRTAFLKNRKLDDKILNIYNRKAKFITGTINNIDENQKLTLLRKFDIIPIINKKKIVVDIIFPRKDNQKKTKIYQLLLWQVEKAQECIL